MKPTKYKLSDLPPDLYEENLMIHNIPVEVPEMKNYLIITSDEILKTDHVSEELKEWAHEGRCDVLDITDPAFPEIWDGHAGKWDSIDEAQGYDVP